MRFNKINKLILFGGSRLTAEFAEYARKKLPYELVVFSSLRHLDEVVKNGKTLRSILRKNKIKFYDSSDINSDASLKKEVVPGTLGLAMGAAWVFSKKTAALFAKRHFLDFMGIDLPRYRGGAHYTWQILHENRRGCANLQIIKGGEETFHMGELVKREEYALPQTLKTPADFFDHIVKRELAFLSEFLGELERGHSFTLQKLNEDKSSYYPFLFTKNSGLIDWSWSGKDIHSFIRAFDDPYAGASTVLNGERVFLKGAELLPAEDGYHPFTSGIVVRNNKRGVFVATVGNLLRVAKVLNEKGKDIAAKVRLGDRLYTPHSKLDESRQFRADYGASGLKSSK